MDGFGHGYSIVLKVEKEFYNFIYINTTINSSACLSMHHAATTTIQSGQPSQFFLENDTLAWNSIEVQNKVSFCIVLSNFPIFMAYMKYTRNLSVKC